MEMPTLDRTELAGILRDFHALETRLRALVERELHAERSERTGLKSRVVKLLIEKGAMTRHEINASLDAEGFAYSKNGLGTMLSHEPRIRWNGHDAQGRKLWEFVPEPPQ